MYLKRYVDSCYGFCYLDYNERFPSSVFLTPVGHTSRPPGGPINPPPPSSHHDSCWVSINVNLFGKESYRIVFNEEKFPIRTHFRECDMLIGSAAWCKCGEVVTWWPRVWRRFTLQYCKNIPTTFTSKGVTSHEWNLPCQFLMCILYACF